MKKKRKVSDKSAWRKFSKEYRASHTCCEVCKKPHKTMNVHHVLPWRYYPAYRFEPLNLVALCPGCHCFSKTAAEVNAVFFAEWLLLNKPEQYKWIKEHL